MIDFRYHLISIIAIFLALAAGVALGAGPLNEPFNEQLASEADRDRSDKAELRDELDEAQDVKSFQNAFANNVGSDMLASRMQDRTVAIFRLPGSDDAAANGLADKIDAAGGTVTTQVSLTEAMIDPSERQFAESVARQSLDGKDAPDTSGMSSYELLGAGLARAYLAEDASEKFDGTSETVVSAYREAGFVETNKNPGERATLAVFVAGGAEDTAEENQDELVATVAAAVDDASSGVVIGGPPSAAEGGGVVAYVRENDIGNSVSTVDAVTVPAGQVVTVLALQREAGGTSGHFGAEAGAGAAMPSVG